MESNIKDLIKKARSKKEQLDALRPLPKVLLKNLDEWYIVELTYSSNAIEGNTLTKPETAIVVEKGLTVSGKPLKDHLEAINHAYALEFIKSLVHQKARDLSLRDILDIHRLILRAIDDQHAGKFRVLDVRIAGSDVKLPSYLKVQELMDEFMQWLHTETQDPILRAADAHLKFVTIHPFVDGNGRTARLLMNLLLMQEGYPPAVIYPEDRVNYINAIEHAQETGDKNPFYKIVLDAVNKSLDVYLKHAQG